MINITIQEKLKLKSKIDLKIILLKKHKYLRANNLFWHKDKLLVKIQNYEIISINTTIFNIIDFINKTNSFKNIAIYLNEKTKKNIKVFIDNLSLQLYDFLFYKSEKKIYILNNIFVLNKNFLDKKFKFKIKKLILVNKNINLVRDMINFAACDTTPYKISNWIKRELKNTQVKCIIQDDKYIKNNMPAFFDISKGSIYKPYFVHLKYNENKGFKKVVLIGKGITFDTGGISLKPSEHMLDMKLDKAGALTAFGIIKSISELNLNLEVHAILGFGENMISNLAYKPGDILKTRSLKTIEIMNTDAEGRILLADLFEFVQDKIEDIDYIIDYATLSGSVIGAIGEYSATLIGHNNKLKQEWIKLAKKADEFYVDLPFNRYLLQNPYKSNIADFSNLPTNVFGAGTIMAGAFLDNFIDKKYKNKWLHIDIAGTSFVNHEWKYSRYGATGFGIKSCIKFCEMLINKD